tara:strand:+ start:1045 stop:1983 length:939 start_codon:yes stop_codon:yes gene_type:complete
MKNNKRTNNKKTHTKKANIDKRILAEAMSHGDVTSKSGLHNLVIHDRTKHRTFTDKGQMPRSRTRDGQKMEFECFVKRRSTAGPTEATLTMRSIISVLDRETVIRILTEAPEFVTNPENALSVSRQLMEDGLITQSMVEEILDERHPAWSQLNWKEDTDLESDFIKAFQSDPQNKDKDIKDAKQAFESLPTDLYRKEGTVTVSVRTDKGKRDFKMDIACEKVTLDKGRYFIALAKNCSPFRTGWLKLHGWKGKGRQIEGRAKDHRSVPKTTPSFVKEEKSVTTLGDALLSQNPGSGSIMDLLKSGETFTHMG